MVERDDRQALFGVTGAGTERTGGGAVKPLAMRRDLPPGSPEALVADLLRAQKRYRMPLGRRQRIGLALAHQQPRTRSNVALVLRPVVIIALVLGSGTIASATLWSWPRWVESQYHRLVGGDMPPAVPTVPPLASRPRLRRAVRPDAAEAPMALGVTASPLGAAGNAPSILPSATGTRRRATVHRVGAGPGVPLTAASEEETSRVFAALRALRRAHDPVRARYMLASYLRDYPRGALVEEALALSIEAAVSHGDHDAGELAGLYLRLYPSGSFRALARQTLDSSTKP